MSFVVNPRIVNIGLVLILLCLLAGVGQAWSFSLNEDSYNTCISPTTQVLENRETTCDSYQRDHHYSIIMLVLCIGLLIILMFGKTIAKLKHIVFIRVDLDSLYLSGCFTLLIVLSLGRNPFHQLFLTEFFAYIGFEVLSLGIVFFLMNLLFELLKK